MSGTLTAEEIYFVLAFLC